MPTAFHVKILLNLKIPLDISLSIWYNIGTIKKGVVHMYWELSSEEVYTLSAREALSNEELDAITDDISFMDEMDEMAAANWELTIEMMESDPELA